MHILRRLRKPKCWIIIGGLFFLTMGTLYWSLWDLPEWFPLFVENEKQEDMESSSSFGQGNNNDGSSSTSSGGSGLFLPEPLNCIQDTVPAQPNTDRYCVWNKNTVKQNSDCEMKMMPNLRSKTSYVFLGDGHMAKLAQAVSTKWKPILFDESLNITTTTRRHPCQNLAYYGLPPPKHGWISPDTSEGEGPIAYGKDHPYCTDCRKCWNILMETPPTPPQQQSSSSSSSTVIEVDRYLEYLVIEYSRDVTVPTLVTNTSQETAAYYLSHHHHRKSPPSICITSTGLNDAAMTPPISLDLYIKNVDKYLALLQRVCQNVVWISIHAIVENVEEDQRRNCKLQQWNNAVLGQIAMRNYSNVYYIDVWDTTMETNHEGFLGLEKDYYTDFSQLFINLMKG